MSDDYHSVYPAAERMLPTSDALAEAEPMSMQELFSRDPRLLTDFNIEEIVRYQIENRKRLESTATVKHVRVKKEPVQKRDFAEIDFSSLMEN